MIGTLKLEDGKLLNGKIFGRPKTVSGEVVFNTGMVGYPEALTDPSYYGQILVLTYPLIGNYGVSTANFESKKIQVTGVIVSTITDNPSHYTSKKTFNDWLYEQNIPGLYGIDTRFLTTYLRTKGVMLAKLSSDSSPTTGKFFDPDKINLVKKVSCRRPIVYGNGRLNLGLIDCGVKLGIIRETIKHGARLTRVPWNWSDFSKFDGLIISNGPGDPKKVPQTTKNIQNYLKINKPLLGICLGSQLLALATGAKTYKLPFGHRSQNQPVINRYTNKAYLTTQNHGYAVDTKTLGNGWKEWFTNLNDQTNEGIKHKNKPWMAVQFHPEGNPGPEDTSWIFHDFIELCKKY